MDFLISFIGGIFGSGALIGLATLLSNILLSRVTEYYKKEYNKEIEQLKADNIKQLEQIKAENAQKLEDSKIEAQEKLAESKAIFDTGMKEIDVAFDSIKQYNSQFHDISKESYQKVFDSKISAYNKLLFLKTDFYNTSTFIYYNLTNEDIKKKSLSDKEFFDEKGARFIVDLKAHVETNRMYLSKEICDAFDIWRSKIASHTLETVQATYAKELIKLKEELAGKTDEESKAHVADIVNTLNTLAFIKILHFTMDEIINFFALVDLEVEKIKAHYNL